MAAPTNQNLNDQLTAQVKAIGVPLVSIIAVILLIIFAIVPLWGRVSGKLTELSSLKKTLASLTTKEEELNNLDTSTTADKFAHAEAALPSGKEVPSLLVGLSKLYQDQGLQLTALKLTPGNVATAEAAPVAPGTQATSASPVVSGNVGIGNQVFPKDKRLDFDLVLSGSLEQARGFLKTLEKSVRLMVVNSFNFASSPTTPSTITFKLTAPFEPAPPLPENFSDPLPKLTTEDEKYLKIVSSYTPITTPFTNVFSGNNGTNPFGGAQTVVPSVTATPTSVPTRAATSSARTR